MHAKADKGEIDKKVVGEFDAATKKQKGGFKALPGKAKQGPAAAQLLQLWGRKG